MGTGIIVYLASGDGRRKVEHLRKFPPRSGKRSSKGVAAPVLSDEECAGAVTDLSPVWVLARRAGGVYFNA
jgi:hypothetical protein